MKHIFPPVCVMLLSLLFMHCSNKPEQPTPGPNPLDKLLGEYTCNDSFYKQEVITSSEDGTNRSNNDSGSSITEVKITKVSESKFLLTQSSDPYLKDTITYKGEFYNFYWSSPYSDLEITREVQFFPDQDSIHIKEESRDKYYLSLKPEDNDIVRVYKLRLISGKKI